MEISIILLHYDFAFKILALHRGHCNLIKFLLEKTVAEVQCICLAICSPLADRLANLPLPPSLLLCFKNALQLVIHYLSLGFTSWTPIKILNGGLKGLPTHFNLFLFSSVVCVCTGPNTMGLLSPFATFARDHNT